MTNTLMYYIDFGSEISFELDGKKFTTLISGQLRDGQILPINRDANKQISRYTKPLDRRALHFTGNTYLFQFENDRLALVPSNEVVDELPLPPTFRSAARQSLFQVPI